MKVFVNFKFSLNKKFQKNRMKSNDGYWIIINKYTPKAWGAG